MFCTTIAITVIMKTIIIITALVISLLTQQLQCQKDRQSASCVILRHLLVFALLGATLSSFVFVKVRYVSLSPHDTKRVAMETQK